MTCFRSGVWGVAIGLLVVTVPAAFALPVDTEWTGAASDAWEDGGNWSSGSPGSADTAAINNADTAVVEGINTELAELTVGYEPEGSDPGTGSLSILSGSFLPGTLTATDLWVGRGSGSAGDVTVTGGTPGDAGWLPCTLAAQHMRIGSQGTGTLSVQDGAWAVAETLDMGIETGSTGLVTVGGAGGPDGSEATILLLMRDPASGPGIVTLNVGMLGQGTLQVNEGGFVGAVDYHLEGEEEPPTSIPVANIGAQARPAGSDPSRATVDGIAMLITAATVVGGSVDSTVATDPTWEPGDALGLPGGPGELVVSNSWASLPEGAQAWPGAFSLAQTEVMPQGTLTLDMGIVTTTALLVNGGVFQGNGYVVPFDPASGQTALVVNQGVVSPGLSAGLLSYALTDYVQQPEGSLRIELGGYTEPSIDPDTGDIILGDFDLLTIDGSAALDGELIISLINGFVPQPGDEFPVLLASAGMTGDFSLVTVEGFPDTLMASFRNGCPISAGSPVRCVFNG